MSACAKSLVAENRRYEARAAARCIWVLVSKLSAEQCTNVNLLPYMAVLVVLQFFSRFSTVTPFLAALPLIVVLAITGLKDGYEDLKRHQSDRAINGIKVSEMSNRGFDVAHQIYVQVLTLRGTFHNPNLCHPKSRSFGLPKWLTTFFLKRALVKEADEAEESRNAERKKGFWGKRRIRRPTLKGSKKPSMSNLRDQEIGHDSEGTRIDALGGGDVQSAKREGKESKTPPTVSEPKVPAVGEREEGDEYEDERDAGPLDGPQQAGSLLHLPSMHLPEGMIAGHDKPLWVKECWEDLRVGDFVRLRGDESVPAGE